MRKLVVLLVTSVALIATVVGVAVADPGLTPTGAFVPHKHFIQQTDGTLVEVGPRVCDEGDASPRWGAFLQFHSNLHTHTNMDGAIGPVAPGLHPATAQNELVPRLCSFNP